MAFFAGDDIINDYRCTKPFTESRLKSIATTLTERKNWLNDIGIKFLVVIVPNKHNIYPENLPYTIKPIRNESRFDQLKEYLNKNTDVEMIDMRNSLIKGKKQYPTYCNTDTHWTRFGALIAASNIVEKLKNDFPDICEFNLNDYNFKLQKSSGDLARMLNMDKTFNGENVKVIPQNGFKAKNTSFSFSVPKHFRKTVVKETKNDKLPSVLIFRDSFSDALAPLLSEYFFRSTYVWCYNFLPEIVEAEMPDVVILEVAERLINYTGVKNPPQVKNRYHKSGRTSPDKHKIYYPIVFETFDSTHPQNWILKNGITISNNTLSFNANSNLYLEACLVMNQIKPNKDYKLTLRTRKKNKNSEGWLLIDLFLADRYDNSEQEMLLPIKEISKEWKTFSKTFNSENVPKSFLLRLGTKASAPIEIDWIKLEENK